MQAQGHTAQTTPHVYTARPVKKRLVGNRYTIDRNSCDYPAQLRETEDPPDVLYVIGNPEALRTGLAVVGARKATPYGISCAERFAQLAAQRGIPIISGGAYGCDSAAHKGALELGAQTVAVLGGGCDQVYPARNFSLFQDIVNSEGAVISEHDWMFPPQPYTFRMRNRIIAGLALATLIVEAGLPSGTFSTADEALQAGREVLVVPGAITSPNSRGANRLLFQGALPVVDDESFTEMLSTIFFQDEQGKRVTERKQSASDQLIEDPLIMALLAQPLNVEEIHRLASEYANGENVASWVSIRLERAQECGMIMHYPDGTYGPQA